MYTHVAMAEYARPPISESTKALIDEKKPQGASYDLFIRHAVEHAPPLGGASAGGMSGQPAGEDYE